MWARPFPDVGALLARIEVDEQFETVCLEFESLGMKDLPDVWAELCVFIKQRHEVFRESLRQRLRRRLSLVTWYRFAAQHSLMKNKDIEDELKQ